MLCNIVPVALQREQALLKDWRKLHLVSTDSLLRPSILQNLSKKPLRKTMAKPKTHST